MSERQLSFLNPKPRPPTAPYQSHSHTSKVAADKILAQTGRLEQLVYRELKSSPQGLTDLELQSRLNLDGSTQRPRRVKLQQLGLVRDSGRTRVTRSGRSAVVWEVVDE